MKPMLARRLPEDSSPTVFINNPAWIIQQKLDGDRLYGEVEAREVKGWSRNGESVRFPDNVAFEFDHKGFDGKWAFDGELLGDTYFVFDVFMEAAGITHRTPHGQRFDFLIELFSKWKPEYIKLVPYAKGKDKETFFKACQQHKAEGVIFKLDRGLYRPDERTYEALKYKFTTSADVFVTALNKNGTDLGVELGVYDKGCLTSAGGVKVPKEVIEFLSVGDVIEVNYLYAEKSHKLYQPTWNRVRWDKKDDECTTDQFKYTNKEPVEA